MTATQPSPQILDVTGYRCPLPVLKAGKALRAMARGEILEIRATDPMTLMDIPHFCHEAGHELLSSGEEGGHIRFLIRRGEARETAREAVADREL